MLRSLLGCVGLFLLFGCTASETGGVEVECDNGQAREIPCGLKDNGVQQQLCVDYQWTDDGVCDDPSECLGSETRIGTASCGFNDRGAVREQCDDGLWTPVDEISTHKCASDDNPAQCACMDPDTCVDGQEGTQACGFEDSGEQATLCVDGSWTINGICGGGYVCNAPDTRIDEGTCGLNGRGDQAFECTDAGTWAPTTCSDPDACEDGKVREAECVDEIGGNGLPKIKRGECDDGEWGEWSACEDSLVCEPGEEETITCGVEGNYSGLAYRECGADRMWATSDCWQQGHFIYSAPYGALIRTEDKHLLTVGDNQNRTAGLALLDDDTYLLPTKTDAVDPQGRYRRFSASTSHQCGINKTGLLFCWGDNTHGQLGERTAGVSEAQPASVTALTKVRAVAVGEGFSCALVGDRGDVYCWGQNDRQQLGRDDDIAASATPVKILEGVSAIAAGDAHACAARSNTVYCWGANDARQAADIDAEEIATPTLHNVLSMDPGASAPPDSIVCDPKRTQSEVTGLAAGRAHTLVSWRTTWRKQFLYLLACGNTNNYQTNFNVVGAGSTSHAQSDSSASMWEVIVDQRSLQREYAPRAMGDVSCIVDMREGTPMTYLCRGDNTAQQLSDIAGNVSEFTEIPSDLSQNESVVEIAIGFDSLCALLDTTQRIRCRGRNDFGQLGDGTMISRTQGDFMLHELMGDTPAADAVDPPD